MVISKVIANQSQTIMGTPSENEKISQKKVNNEKGALSPWNNVSEADSSENNVSLKSNFPANGDDMNTLARDLRSAGKRLVKINDFVERMKGQLDKIVKNYPPFPADSPERAELLKSFIGLRKEIERMTLPPEEQYFPQLPLVSAKTSDQEVSKVIESLDRAAATISQKQADLASRVEEIGASQYETIGEADALNKMADVMAVLPSQPKGLSGEIHVETLRQLLG